RATDTRAPAPWAPRWPRWCSRGAHHRVVVLAHPLAGPRHRRVELPHALPRQRLGGATDRGGARAVRVGDGERARREAAQGLEADVPVGAAALTAPLADAVVPGHVVVGQLEADGEGSVARRVQGVLDGE